jgi:predicted nucleic acid-binding protein
MNGSKVLLDSNIIIFASKQLINIDTIFARYSQFFVSIVTLMEVYGYTFGNPNEEQLIDELFKELEIVELTKYVAQYVIAYRKQAKKIKLPDAIILASARYIGADLMTDDWDDMKGIDENVHIVSLEGLKLL